MGRGILNDVRGSRITQSTHPPIYFVIFNFLGHIDTTILGVKAEHGEEGSHCHLWYLMGMGEVITEDCVVSPIMLVLSGQCR